jgi:hypothetical protein
MSAREEHHDNDHKPRDMKNKRKSDHDGDEGSDSRKLRMEKMHPTPNNITPGVALQLFRIFCWKLERSMRCVSTVVPKNIDPQLQVLATVPGYPTAGRDCTRPGVPGPDLPLH